MTPARCPSHRPSTAALLALALAAVLAGCGGDDATAEPVRPEATTGFTADVPVLVPGRPGEAPETVAPGGTGSVPNALAYGDADVAFVRDMVPHHAQALEMADLAAERAGDERVLSLAERVVAGQGPEIDLMQRWLSQQGLEPADDDHTMHTGMPGMASAEQLFALGQSEGEDFDRLFLELMVRHHQGAVQMAGAADLEATSVFVQDLAKDVGAEQSVEAGRMQTVLQEL